MPNESFDLSASPEKLAKALRNQFDNIDADGSGSITHAEVNDFAQHKDLNREQTAVSEFLQKHVYDIGALSKNRFLQTSDIDRMEILAKFDPSGGSNSSKILVRSIAGGAAGGAAATSLDSQASASDYADGAGKGAAVGAAIGAVAAIAAETKFQNAVRDKQAMVDWGFFQGTQNEREPHVRPGLQKRDIKEVAEKYLPMLDLNQDNCLSKDELAEGLKASSKFIPDEVKPELKFINDNIEGISHLSEATLQVAADKYDKGLASRHDLEVLGSKLKQEKKVTMTLGSAVLGAVGCAGGAVAGGLVANVPGAIGGCVAGAGLAGGGRMALNARGMEERNQRRAAIYTKLDSQLD
jgi:Ca2+-binding EF-hand superfamily protein